MSKCLSMDTKYSQSALSFPQSMKMNNLTSSGIQQCSEGAVINVAPDLTPNPTPLLRPPSAHSEVQQPVPLWSPVHHLPVPSSAPVPGKWRPTPSGATIGLPTPLPLPYANTRSQFSLTSAVINTLPSPPLPGNVVTLEMENAGFGDGVMVHHTSPPPPPPAHRHSG